MAMQLKPADSGVDEQQALPLRPLQTRQRRRQPTAAALAADGRCAAAAAATAASAAGGVADGGGAAGSSGDFTQEQSEGYCALLQLLRAKTPAELLRGGRRGCAHIVADKDSSMVPTAPGGKLESIRRECNEILLSNGKEVDTPLLASPDRSIFVPSARRKGRGRNAWPKPLCCRCVVGRGAQRDDESEGGLQGEDGCGTRGASAPPKVTKSRSHLKRPAGLALHDLQVPALPAGVGPSGGGPISEAAGGLFDGKVVGDIDEIGEGLDDLELPLVDVASAVSPALASVFGIAPQSMRSFLRLDDMTFDLLSPLGTGRQPTEKSGGSQAVDEAP